MHSLQFIVRSSHSSALRYEIKHLTHLIQMRLSFSSALASLFVRLTSVSA